MGLGNMGAALASTVLSRNGHVTVWNRTASKADKLVAAGAMLAGSAAEAIASTDVCIVCVGNYEHTKDIVRASADLSGKVLVQLSTGSPEEGEALQKWANERGARYIDGVILAYPSDIGHAGTMIICAGDRDAWDACQQTLMQLAGASRYVGTNIAAPVALEHALIVSLLMGIVGLMPGVLAVERAGIDVALLSELIAGSGPLFVKGMKSQVDAIAENRLPTRKPCSAPGPQASNTFPTDRIRTSISSARFVCCCDAPSMRATAPKNSRP